MGHYFLDRRYKRYGLFIYVSRNQIERKAEKGLMGKDGNSGEYYYPGPTAVRGTVCISWASI